MDTRELTRKIQTQIDELRATATDKEHEMLDYYARQLASGLQQHELEALAEQLGVQL